jgi:hypothetical protein
VVTTTQATKCAGQWLDREHLTLPAAYLVQTVYRIENGADPIKLCGRCVAEWRANDLDQPFIAWIRSL